MLRHSFVFLITAVSVCNLEKCALFRFTAVFSHLVLDTLSPTKHGSGVHVLVLS